MPLTIYEVVSSRTKDHQSEDNDDWSVFVAANNPTEARDIAVSQTTLSRPWVIYEWGVDTRANGEPAVLRGPVQTYPAYNRGWKQYCEKLDSDSPQPPVVEWEQR